MSDSINDMMAQLEQTAREGRMPFGVKAKLALATALLISAFGPLSPDVREVLLDTVNDQVMASPRRDVSHNLLIAVESPALLQ